MSPRRRQAQLAAEVSDDLVLIAPSTRTQWHVRKRTLQGRRIRWQQPRKLQRIIHGVAAYTILVALATGCVTDPFVAHERWKRETFKDDYTACGFANCRLLLKRPISPEAEQQLQKSFDNIERTLRDDLQGGGDTLLCFPGRITTLCIR